MAEFEQIYRKHVDAVFRYAWHCVGRRDVAEDITSEAFLQLYRNMERIDPRQLPGWLLTVVRNRAIDYWRKSSRENLCADPPARSARDPEQSLEALLLETKALKVVHRVCLILRYVHGMSRAEIARATALSETQVKGYLQYALQLLRQQLLERAPGGGHVKTME